MTTLAISPAYISINVLFSPDYLPYEYTLQFMRTQAISPGDQWLQFYYDLSTRWYQMLEGKVSLAGNVWIRLWVVQESVSFGWLASLCEHWSRGQRLGFFFSPSGTKLGNDGSNGADGLDGGIMGEEAYDMTALEVWAGVGLHEDL